MFQYQIVLFRNAEGKPTFVIEEFNQEINQNLLENEEGKYFHFEGRKFVKVNGKLRKLEKEELLEFYKKRLISGPIEEFESMERNVCGEEITDFTDPHGQAANFDDEMEELMTG